MSFGSFLHRRRLISRSQLTPELMGEGLSVSANFDPPGFPTLASQSSVRTEDQRAPNFAASIDPSHHSTVLRAHDYVFVDPLVHPSPDLGNMVVKDSPVAPYHGPHPMFDHFGSNPLGTQPVTWDSKNGIPRHVKIERDSMLFPGRLQPANRFITKQKKGILGHIFKPPIDSFLHSELAPDSFLDPNIAPGDQDSKELLVSRLKPNLPETPSPQQGEAELANFSTGTDVRMQISSIVHQSQCAGLTHPGVQATSQALQEPRKNTNATPWSLLPQYTLNEEMKREMHAIGQNQIRLETNQRTESAHGQEVRTRKMNWFSRLREQMHAKRDKDIQMISEESKVTAQTTFEASQLHPHPLSCSGNDTVAFGPQGDLCLKKPIKPHPSYSEASHRAPVHFEAQKDVQRQTHYPPKEQIFQNHCADMIAVDPSMEDSGLPYGQRASKRGKTAKKEEDASLLSNEKSNRKTASNTLRRALVISPRSPTESIPDMTKVEIDHEEKKVASSCARQGFSQKREAFEGKPTKLSEDEFYRSYCTNSLPFRQDTNVSGVAEPNVQEEADLNYTIQAKQRRAKKRSAQEQPSERDAKVPRRNKKKRSIDAAQESKSEKTLIEELSH